jgi:hypothetical protein
MNILKANILLTLTLLVSTTLLAQQAHSAEREVRVTKAEQVGMSSERLTRIGRGMRRLIDAGLNQVMNLPSFDPRFKVLEDIAEKIIPFV